MHRRAHPGQPRLRPPAGHLLRAARGRWAARPRRDPRLDEPVLLTDEHGDVAIYGLPYLEPEVARFELGLPSARSHEAVLAEAMDRVRADLFLRPGVRSVVLAHAFVGGGQPSESERDISVGGVDLVPAAVFDGVDYVALGHLHRPQTLSPRLRYSGSPLAYSFGEAGQQKQAWLVDLDAAGAGRRACGAAADPAPADRADRHPRRAAVRSGPRRGRAALRLGPAHRRVRPTDPMRRLQARFPHCVHLEWAGSGAGGDGRSYQDMLRGRSDMEVVDEFVSRVRAVPATSAERDLLGRALAAAARAEVDA